MNDISYSFHYRNLDSTKYYANKALKLSKDYDNGYAEALNNLAFVSIVKMNYDNAYKLLNKIFTSCLINHLILISTFLGGAYGHYSFWALLQHSGK